MQAVPRITRRLQGEGYISKDVLNGLIKGLKAKQKSVIKLDAGSIRWFNQFKSLEKTIKTNNAEKAVSILTSIMHSK